MEEIADKGSILIVDDDKNIILTLKDLFEEKGYEIEIAETGSDALVKAQRRKFNIAILDIKLPDIEGIELLAPLKEMNPSMVIMIITGYASLDTAIRALNENVAAYFTKPLNIDQVMSIVETKLKKSGEQHRIKISNSTHKKLEKIAKITNTDLQKLTKLAFNEFFELIRNDPEIFFDNLGLINRLKEIFNQKQNKIDG